jgi:hypothetical protein
LRETAIALAGHPAVESTQREAEPGTTLPRQTISWAPARSTGYETPQAQRRVRAHGEVTVERDYDCRGRHDICSVDEHHRQTAMTVFDEPIGTVVRVMREGRRHLAHAARVTECLRRCCYENSAGIALRQPGD